MSDEIKDCPFCGDQGFLREGHGKYLVECRNEYTCTASIAYQKSEEEAIRIWNNRVRCMEC